MLFLLIHLLLTLGDLYRLWTISKFDRADEYVDEEVLAFILRFYFQLNLGVVTLVKTLHVSEGNHVLLVLDFVLKAFLKHFLVRLEV